MKTANSLLSVFVFVFVMGNQPDDEACKSDVGSCDSEDKVVLEENSDRAPNHAEGLGPKITVSSLQAGEIVNVFHRYAQDPNGYFIVQHSTSGMLHPSIGFTDTWTTAFVSESWNIQSFDPDNYTTWVEIQWAHPLWYNRRGRKLEVDKIEQITQRVLPQQIRRHDAPSEAEQQPVLTLFHVRWGGEKPVDPVTEGAGGWGQIGSTPSDNYINAWEDHIFEMLGPTYEIISAFVQTSEELLKISPPLLRHLMRGRHFGALYFAWPIIF